MFTSANNRAAAYRNASVDTVVHNATPHQLIVLLFDGLLHSVRAAHGALERSELATKGEQLGRAVRILEEGLKGSLDMQKGGELAGNLRALYDYCVARLTDANLKNDAAALAEVSRLIEPLAESWRQIGTAMPADISATTTSAAAASAHHASVAAPSHTGVAHMRASRAPSVSAYSAGI